MQWFKDRDNGSLPQEAEYDIDDHLILGRQKKWKRVIEWILTILGWIIMFSYVGYVVYGNLALEMGWYLPEGWLYNRYMLQEVDRYYYILLLVLLAGFVLFIIWKNYNKRKYGSLHRRDFRSEVSKEELMEKFEVDAEMLESLQNDRVITLEKNIIPEALGVGRREKK